MSLAAYETEQVAEQVRCLQNGYEEKQAANSKFEVQHTEMSDWKVCSEKSQVCLKKRA